MQMKTLVADTFPESHLDRLKQLGCELDYAPSARAEDLPSLSASRKILIVRGKKVTGETLNAARDLALVLRAGAGVNTIDVKTASSLGIFVSNCPGKNSIAVAELVFALLLAIDRRIPENVAALRAGQWNKKEFSHADGAFRQDARGDRRRQHRTRGHPAGARLWLASGGLVAVVDTRTGRGTGRGTGRKCG